MRDPSSAAGARLARGTAPRRGREGSVRRRGSDSRRSRDGALLGLHRGNLRTALVAAACLAGAPHAASMALGGAVVGLGLVLHVAAKGCLRQNRVLALRGPYRWVRHPFYLGNLLIDLGVCAAAARPELALAAVLLGWRIYGASVRSEEALLTARFGEAYRRYARRVPRLLPGRRPLPRDPRAEGFSWQNPNLARGSEYARVARILSVLPLLWVCTRARDALLGGAGPPASLGALADEATALALLVVLRALQWGLRRRFKQRRPLLPAWARSEAAVVASVGVVAAATLRGQAVESDSHIAALALPGAALTIGLLCRSLPGRPAARLLALGLACVAATASAGLAWLGILGGGWFALLALDAEGPAPAPRRLRPAVPAVRRRVVFAGVLLLLAASLLEEGLEHRPPATPLRAGTTAHGPPL